MLSDNHCQLLTAYLDGDLGMRQRKAVLRLLRKSPEARELLRQMQQDTERLRSLPQRRLAQDFPLQVLRTIAERGVRPTSPKRPPVRPMQTWIALAAAASVLLMVTAASYVYFSHLGTEPDQQTAVVKLETPVPRVQPEEQPSPPPVPPPLDTGLKLALRHLGDANARTQFTDALQRDTSYHLNLGTRDNVRAVDHLKAVLKTKGIEVMVERRAQANLKKKQKSSYWLFAENIKPGELANILQALGTDIKKGPKNAPPQHTFDTVVLNSLTNAQRQQMAKLLGVTAEKLQAPRRLPAGQALPPEMFQDNIIEAPPGAAPATAKTRPAVPQPERYALVLASHLDTGGHPMMSPEIQRFLQRRQEQQQQPGTLQVILELHEVSA